MITNLSRILALTSELDNQVFNIYRNKYHNFSILINKNIELSVYKYISYVLI